jgi:hypothetical protein
VGTGSASAPAASNLTGDDKPQGRMRARIILILLGLFVVVVALSGYVMASAAIDIAAARRALSGGSLRLDPARIDNARQHLAQAEKAFESLPARVVGWLPVVKQNFQALEGIAEKSLPVVEAAGDLTDAMEGLNSSSFFENGTVELGLLEDLEHPLRAQTAALSALVDELRLRRNGWLLPPVWSELDRLLDQAEELRISAETGAGLVGVAPAMLGDSEERTYLVALMNNTELRGSGGILSGVGSLTVRKGRVSLGEFQHYKELAGPAPFQRVSAPTDFRRNFGTYKADTTRWVTATSSPDLPDVATVTRALFELATDTKTDGVIFVDPRGLAAMLPPAATLRVPTTDTSVTPAEMPRYVYQEAYKELGGGDPRRRESLINLGEAAFDLVLERGFGRPSLLRSMAEAAAGGHIGMVAFAPDEARALGDARLNRDLGEPEYDGVLVTVQNIGGNKLDSYARREIHHSCRIDAEAASRCETTVTLANKTPKGLTPYEYQYRPYGMFRNVLEIYIPANADLQSVEIGGEPEDYFDHPEDGYRAVGVPIELPRGESTTMRVAYDLPAEDGYTLEVIPQPLVVDASLEIELAIPDRWEVDGPEGVSRDDSIRWEGMLDRRIRFEAGSSERSGLAALWEGLGHFLREPLL